MKQSAIAISLGTLCTLLLVLSLWFVASEIARLGVDSWVTDKIGNETNLMSVEQIKDVAQEKMREYYGQWHIVSLQVVLISLGFVVGGYVTAKLAKNKAYLHSAIVGGAVSVVILSLFIPIYIIAAIAGAYFAEAKTNEKYI
jgi:hypothetical protein